MAQLAQEVYNSDLLQVLIPRLGRVDFEVRRRPALPAGHDRAGSPVPCSESSRAPGPQSRKDTALIFGNLLRRQIGARAPTVDYLCTHDQILGALVRSYDNPDVALSAGLMLRDCAKHEALTKIILNSEDFYRFFDYVELSTFDVASDAFSTFRVRRTIEPVVIGRRCFGADGRAVALAARCWAAGGGPQELLTRHKALVAEFLEANYDKVGPLRPRAAGSGAQHSLIFRKAGCDARARGARSSLSTPASCSRRTT